MFGPNYESGHPIELTTQSVVYREKERALNYSIRLLYSKQQVLKRGWSVQIVSRLYRCIQ